MLQRRRKTDTPVVIHLDVDDSNVSTENEYTLQQTIVARLKDYIKLIAYCLLLTMPLYAIVVSVLQKNWTMVFIDALIFPVGFVHGLLLIFGFVT